MAPARSTISRSQGAGSSAGRRLTSANLCGSRSIKATANSQLSWIPRKCDGATPGTSEWRFRAGPRKSRSARCSRDVPPCPPDSSSLSSRRRRRSPRAREAPIHTGPGVPIVRSPVEDPRSISLARARPFASVGHSLQQGPTRHRQARLPPRYRIAVERKHRHCDRDVGCEPRYEGSSSLFSP